MRSILLCLLLFCGAALAQEPMPRAGNGIRLPGGSPAPVPGVQRLSGDLWYVIDSDVDLIVLTSPAGRIATTKEAGPLRVRGRFVDGTGKVETRTFAGKHVYTLEAAASGACEVLIVPVGATSAADVLRRSLEVEAGPTPPGPGPGPPPDPPRPTPPDTFTRTLQTAYDADTGSEKQRHARTLGAVWRQAIKDCDDARWTTAGQLLAIVREASAAVVPADALVALRKLVATELLTVMPRDPDAELTPELRVQAKALFGRVATALEVISK